MTAWPPLSSSPHTHQRGGGGGVGVGSSGECPVLLRTQLAVDGCCDSTGRWQRACRARWRPRRLWAERHITVRCRQLRPSAPQLAALTEALSGLLGAQECIGGCFGEPLLLLLLLERFGLLVVRVSMMSHSTVHLAPRARRST